MERESLVKCGQNIRTKQQLFNLIDEMGLFNEEEDKLHANDFTIAQLQKIWNERGGNIQDGGR